MLYTFVVAAILITLAELGDKTQLLVLALACRYKAWQVLAGVAMGSLAVHLLATAAGTLVGDVIPTTAVAVVAGLLFIGFGIWTLRGASGQGGEDEAPSPSRFGPVLTVTASFFVAELGDKTQVMAAAIAADPSAVLRTVGAAGPAITRALSSVGLGTDGVGGAPAFLGVWLGAVTGMLIVDGLAVFVGASIGKRLSPKVVARVSGVVFIIFGIATLVSAFLTGN